MPEKKTMELEILSPTGLVFRGEVSAVFLPGSLCPFEVLTGHAPIISLLDEGDITYVAGAQKFAIAVKDGFVKVKDNRITVCVEQ